MSTEFRLEQVERRLDRMSKRVRELELELELGGEGQGQEPVPVGWTPPPAQPQRQAPPVSAPPPPPSRPAVDFEELFGGRVLAWVGGLAILFGAVLFLGMAISRDWIDEVARTVIAMLGSIALLGVGVWLHEGKGRTEAARAAAASAIFGLYATLIVATQVYELISPGLGLALGAVIAAVGLAIAVRWSSWLVATIGSLGALGAPLMVGSGVSDTSIAFVAIALVAVVGILLWQRWDVLALGAFLFSAPQLVAWVSQTGSDAVALPLAVLIGFWVLYLVAAFGFELRSRAEGSLPAVSLLLVFASSALVVAGGHYVFARADDHTGTVIWIFGFAALHVLLGGTALWRGFHREIGALLIGTGISLAALGLAMALDGPALVLAWAAGAAALALVSTRLDAAPDPAVSNAGRLLFAAGVFLGLALVHTLAVEAPPQALYEGVEPLGAAVAAIAACAAAAFVCGLCARRFDPNAVTIAGFVVATMAVYLGSVLIVDAIGVDAAGEPRQVGQVWLSVFWTVTGLGAVVYGLVRRSAPVRQGGLALLAVAIVKVWTYDLSALDELARVLSFLGLGLLLLVGSFAYQRIKPGSEGGPPAANG
jgi:uncharacterized membrane protein